MSIGKNDVKQVYWRSLEALAGSPELAQQMSQEFPPGAFEEYLATRAQEKDQAGTADGVSRRKFMGFMTASVAAASTALSGCIRKPYEKIVAFKERPEDMVPGRPNYYATAALSGATVVGLLVESHDGRPTKVEGNPNHPINGDTKLRRAGTDPQSQASVLELYEADRSQKILRDGNPSTEAEWKESLEALAKEAAASRGKNLAIVLPFLPSPTVERLLGELKTSWPDTTIALEDPTFPENSLAGLALAGLAGRGVLYDLESADLVVALDADLLGQDENGLRHAAQYARRRRADLDKQGMARLYSVEPTFSITGMQADNRLPLKPSQVGPFAAALATELSKNGVSLPAGAEGLSKLSAEGKAAQWASVIAKELSFAKGRSVVAAGPRQPAWVHATALAINAALGNIGKTVQIVERPKSAASARLADVVAGLEKGDITAVVVLGANPAYTAPADLNFASAFSKASTRVHLGASLDETGALAQWHVPLAHYLEAWGDLRASDGSISVQQPLIAPLYPAAKSVIEVLLALQGQKTSGYDAVRATWSSLPGAGASDKGWRKALHSGVVENTAYSLGGSVPDFSSLAGSIPASVATSGFEVVYALDYKVLDGRHTNNPWLQELPDPVTKLTWDNAAYVSPATAEKLGLPPTGAIGQYEAAMLSVAIDGRSLELAGWPTPGVAPDTVIIPQGYGRKVGHFATGTGFNANAVRTTANAYFGVGAAVSKAQGSYTLATTQDHGSTFDGRTNRPIVREATFGDYKKEPNFVEKSEIMPKEKIKSLAPEPPANPLYPQQWGMAIDLNACIGCNACTIACQAENNIPVVGKERILNGREMHWIRLDRYFSGDPEAPRAITQPLPCAHCETAPCETVCPVGATIHSPEGLNDMAYNRCIGTRYCSNNCPFKVRRYNFFHYTQENDRDIPLVKLQRNPDVTVRFRGVMEKCTYCVQRIQGAKIEQKRGGSDKIPDGAVIPACAQACPTNAITFGDVADPNTKVAAAKADPRNYVLLRELNLRARTSYLARISNPNPELA